VPLLKGWDATEAQRRQAYCGYVEILVWAVVEDAILDGALTTHGVDKKQTVCGHSASGAGRRPTGAAARRTEGEPGLTLERLQAAFDPTFLFRQRMRPDVT
jgi:hypothetical protein